MLNGYYELDIADAFSRIYVWLRYSSTRHLTWQRNYNTQPRILSAAQERLTNTISQAHGLVTGENPSYMLLNAFGVFLHGNGEELSLNTPGRVDSR